MCFSFYRFFIVGHTTPLLNLESIKLYSYVVSCVWICRSFHLKRTTLTATVYVSFGYIKRAITSSFFWLLFIRKNFQNSLIPVNTAWRRACFLSQTLHVTQNFVTSWRTALNVICQNTHCYMLYKHQQRFRCKIIFKNKRTFWSLIHHVRNCTAFMQLESSTAYQPVTMTRVSQGNRVYYMGMDDGTGRQINIVNMEGGAHRKWDLSKKGLIWAWNLD